MTAPRDSRLDPAALFSPCDPESLGFASTSDLPDLDEVMGQSRAVDALRFGIGIRRKGFNLYALGPTGVGKHGIVRQLIEEQVTSEATPPDYCYVHNFDDARKPRALALPPGYAIQLRDDMIRLVEELESVVPQALDSEECRARRQELEEKFQQQEAQAFQALQERGEASSVRLIRSPTSFIFAPLKDGEVLDPETYQRLPAEERASIEGRLGDLQAELDRILKHDIPRWRRELRESLKRLNQEVVMSAVGDSMSETRGRYEAQPGIASYLDRVEADVIEHADQLRSREEEASLLERLSGPDDEQKPPFLHRYRVNVLVDHTEASCAPIVYLDNPTHANLVGRIEHQVQLGALVTDFTLIKPGALHEANGGYLILDARKVLGEPYAWEGLKRALRAEEINIEALGQMTGLVSTVSLEPDRVALDLKVVLVGERLLYYLLCEVDPEFNDLFKVAVDFDDEVSREESVHLFARFLATLARKEDLRPLAAAGVAKIIEHASRTIDDAEKLPTRLARISDLVREADFRAVEAGRDIISSDDVQFALDARRQRHSRLRDRWLEAILRGQLLIATDGARTGQINGLSVSVVGESSFGFPCRITARARPGEGEVVDIAREVELGGPLHSKGVLILSGFLSGRYCPDQALSMHASLVFEQTYDMVEGDSASAAELFALLSALSEAPLEQSLAVTGSVDQHGQIQPIGGVNDKIEGFFDLCSERGLTGSQGVVIPASNVKNLMLRDQVVAAVAQGRFHVHAIETADEGIELLTGLRAGDRGPDGDYPEGTVNARVEAKLAAFTRAMTRGAGDDDSN